MLTEDSFNGLLGWLDADKKNAAEKYEIIRRKLLKFFEWRRCRSPEEYTDLTFDRVAKKITEGEIIRTQDKFLYIHGVALNLLKEYFKKPPITNLENDPPNEILTDESDDNPNIIEKQLACLDLLPSYEREMIIAYYQVDALLNKVKRRVLARRYRITENSLRIKVHRIREKLRECLKQSAGG